MSVERRFLELVTVARSERAPMFDVREAVLAEVRTLEGAPEMASGPLMWFAGLSLCAAAGLALLALPAWRLESSPLAALFEPLATMLN
jgi:hypothetical protein